MEHFLNATDDHNSSFFRPTVHDDDDYDEMMPQSSSSPPPPPLPPVAASELPIILPTSPPIVDADDKEEESLVTTDAPRTRLNFSEEANIKLQVLVSNFSDTQLDRYEMYRRSAFSKVSIKRLMHSITGTIPTSNVVIAMAGIAKVFVGEIVEEALQVQREQQQQQELHNDEIIHSKTIENRTPLEPKHLHEAHRRVNNRQPYPKLKTWRSKRKSRF